jgi:hypothetical protein
VTLSNLNTFTIRSKAVVLWSPVLLVRNDGTTIATVNVDGSALRVLSGDEEVLRVVKGSSEGEPIMKIGQVSLAFSRTIWQVVDHTGDTLATIRFASSGTRLIWNVSVDGQHGRRDCTAEERTSLLGRLLGRKWLKKFAILVDDQEIGTINERIYPFGQKLTTDLNTDCNQVIDRRVAVALTSLVLLNIGQSLASPSS